MRNDKTLQLALELGMTPTGVHYLKKRGMPMAAGEARAWLAERPNSRKNLPSEANVRAMKIVSATGISLVMVRRYQAQGMPDASVDLAADWIWDNETRPRPRAMAARRDGFMRCLICGEKKLETEFVKRLDTGGSESRCRECKNGERLIKRRLAGVAERPKFTELDGLNEKDRRNAYKRLKRALDAAKQGKYDAHVKEWKKEVGRKPKPPGGPLLAEVRKQLHDAHVLVFRSAAVQWHIKYKHQPERRDQWIERRRQHREKLDDQYIIRLLNANYGLHKDEIPQELIDAQRAVLKLKRATRTRT